MAVIPSLSIGTGASVPPATTQKPNAEAQKAAFTQEGSKKVISPPRRRAFRLGEARADFVKIFAFGPIGSGKTDILGQLILAGYKVGIVSTDIGDSGHLTITNRLRRAGRLDLVNNALIIPLEGYSEVVSFLRDPHKYEPELLDLNPDILAWDGFSGFQQIDLTEYAGNMNPVGMKSSEQRQAGLQLEQSDWGVVRTVTVRTMNDFLSISHPSGRPYHKIVTCHEAVGYKAKDPNKPNAGQEMVIETFKPLLSGSGAQFVLGGFDLVLRCGKRERNVEENGKRTKRTEFYYTTAGNENTVGKNRGFDLEAEEPGDFISIWNRTALQLDKIREKSSEPLDNPASS